MQLFCKPPERALDVRGARAPRHPKNLIGVTHPRNLRNLAVSYPESLPQPMASMWGEAAPKATRNRGKSKGFLGRPRRGGPNRAATRGAPTGIADRRGALRGRPPIPA